MPVSSPISPAVDHLADLALSEAECVADPQAMASSLAGRLAQVPDPQGRRHPLAVILVRQRRTRPPRPPHPHRTSSPSTASSELQLNRTERTTTGPCD